MSSDDAAVSELEEVREPKPTMIDQCTVECLVCLMDVSFMMDARYLFCCGQIICFKCFNQWFHKDEETIGTCPHCRVVNCDSRSVTAILPQLIDSGKMWAHYYLAWHLLRTTRDYKAWFDQLLLAEQGGDIRACVFVGLAYLKGSGVTLDLEKGREYLAKGSALGIETCSYYLATTYLDIDNDQVIRYMTLALHQNCLSATFQFGYWHLTGKQNVPIDEARGLELLKIAADGRHKYAQFFYGMKLFLKRDFQETIKYLKMALDEEDSHPMKILMMNDKEVLASDEAMLAIATSYSSIGDPLSGYLWVSKVLCNFPESSLITHATTCRDGIKGVISNVCGCCYSNREEMKAPLMMCNGCHTVFYCSKKCQTENWVSHKEFCKSMKELL